MAIINPFAPYYANIFGPLYFAALLSTGLYGVTCMQTFFYYVHYRNDSIYLKLFVGAVWACDTIHTALMVVGVYKYIIATLVDPAALLQQIPELVLQIVTAATVSMPTQAFFIYRIYIFGGRNIVAPILWVLQMIFQIAAAIVFATKALYTSNGHLQAVSTLVIDTAFFRNATTACISVAAGVDVLIAIAMTYLLFQKRTIAGFENSAHILQRLTVFAVNTGIWTAVFAVMAVILLRALPDSNLLYLVFALPLATIYCNTLLANLNARAYIRGEVFTQDLVVMSGTMSSSTRTDAQIRNSTMVSPTPLHIRKATEVVTYSDTRTSNDKYPPLDNSCV